MIYTCTHIASGVEYISNLTNLKYLSLRQSKLTDGAMFHLGVLTNLEHLDLSRCTVQDSGMIFLHRLHRLKVC